MLLLCVERSSYFGPCLSCLSTHSLCFVCDSRNGELTTYSVSAAHIVSSCSPYPAMFFLQFCLITFSYASILTDSLKDLSEYQQQ